MNVLHISSFNSVAKNLGVLRQMEIEAGAAKALDLNWDVVVFSGFEKDIDSEFVRFYPRFAKLRIIKRLLLALFIIKCSRHYDVILLRYSPVDFFLPFVKILSEKHSKILLVFHTKDKIALAGAFSGLRRRVFVRLEDIISRVSVRVFDGYVGVTNDILRFYSNRIGNHDKPVFVYPNGIEICAERDCAKKQVASGVINAIFVASKFFVWNGLDDILFSFNSFDFQRLDMLGKTLKIHIVGDLDSNFGVDVPGILRNGKHEIVFHGLQTKEELSYLMGISDFGIGAFNLGIAGLEEACTLKVREYLSEGLPVYSGHVDVSIPKDFQYYRIGKPEIGAMVDFYFDINGSSRDVVSSAAEQFIDKTTLLKNFYLQLAQEFDG